MSIFLVASLIFTFLLPLFPWYSPSMTLAPPIPLQPSCAILTRLGEEAGIRCCTHCSLGSWEKKLNPGWRGWEGFLFISLFEAPSQPVFIASLRH